MDNKEFNDELGYDEHEKKCYSFNLIVEKEKNMIKSLNMTIV